MRWFIWVSQYAGTCNLKYASASRLRSIGVNIGRVKSYYQSNIGLVAEGEQQNGVQVHIICTLETIGIVFEETLL